MNEKNWKPAGYTDVSPYLIVLKPEKLIDFLKAVFDAKELRRHAAPDGRVMHAEVRIGDSVIMMGSPPDGSSETCHVHIYVKDVDSIYQRAMKAGAKEVQPPVKKSDADRRGGFTDPIGAATWWVATEQE